MVVVQRKTKQHLYICDGNRFYHRIGTQCVSAVGRRLRYFVRCGWLWCWFLADISTDFNWHGIGVCGWFVCWFTDSQIGQQALCAVLVAFLSSLSVVIYANCPRTWYVAACGACLLIYQFGLIFCICYLPKGCLLPNYFIPLPSYLNLAAVSRCHAALYAISVLKLLCINLMPLYRLSWRPPSPRRRELFDQVLVPHTCAAVNIDESRLAENRRLTILGVWLVKSANRFTSLPNAMTECGNYRRYRGVLPDGSVLQNLTILPMLVRCGGKWAMPRASMDRGAVSRLAQRGGQWQMDYAERTGWEPMSNLSRSLTAWWRIIGARWTTRQNRRLCHSGLGAAWVKAIDGSYSNVVGLPLVKPWTCFIKCCRASVKFTQ